MSLSLDDGSGAIRVKAWNETINLFLDVDIGDLVLVIGKSVNGPFINNIQTKN